MSIQILSENLKTNYSINFPRSKTCKPTKLCGELCYGGKGRCAMPLSQNRQTQVWQHILTTPTEELAEQILTEMNSKGITFLRWCGIGDLTDKVVDILNLVVPANLQIKHWVVSRKAEVMCNVEPQSNLYLMYSVDRTTPTREIKKVKTGISTRTYFSYLRDREVATDLETDRLNSAAIIFNAHQKRSVLPYDNKKKCCPVDAGRVPTKGACSSCQRCFSEPVFDR